MFEPACVPLSLYIHFPWCVQKCPYCDFNSHTLKSPLAEEDYIDALILNFNKILPWAKQRPITSIFMGGGTPSLFSAKSIDRLLCHINKVSSLAPALEITLEANPGTVEQQRFFDYRAIGINRISLGIQSFHDQHLKKLGRIHDGSEAKAAIATLRKAGFDNFNLDIMFGLPHQTVQQGLEDLQMALTFEPPHLSWYELTLEPNTQFYQKPPPLPKEEVMLTLQQKGLEFIENQGLKQYEISAFSRNQPCHHNLNYWTFGDYLAIGAGAHGKVTQQSDNILRFQHFRHPKQYLNKQNGWIEQQEEIRAQHLIFEFFLNVLRLKEGVCSLTFFERTGLPLSQASPILDVAVQKQWLKPYDASFCATPLGYQYLNDLISLFLPT